MFADMIHDYWDDAAEYAVTNIFDHAQPDPKRSVADGLIRLRADFDAFIDTKFSDPDTGDDTEAINRWATLGAHAIEISVSRTKPLDVGLVTATLIRKQRDYGHENIRRFGRQGLLVRCHDKVARLENLLRSDATPSNESIEDTLLDVVGYSAIGIMWERDEFLLDLR